MTHDLLILGGEVLLVIVAAGVLALGAVMAMHVLAIHRLDEDDVVPSRDLADFMIDPIPHGDREAHSHATKGLR